MTAATAKVDDLLERRVDRTGARLPGASGALGDGLDDGVAVLWPFGEQAEDGEADVAPTSTLTAGAEATAEARTEPGPAEAGATEPRTEATAAATAVFVVTAGEAGAVVLAGAAEARSAGVATEGAAGGRGAVLVVHGVHDDSFRGR
jgi:hypothetical protein